MTKYSQHGLLPYLKNIGCITRGESKVRLCMRKICDRSSSVPRNNNCCIMFYSQHATTSTCTVLVVIESHTLSVVCTKPSRLSFKVTLVLHLTSASRSESVLKHYCGPSLLPFPTTPETPWVLYLPSQQSLGTCLASPAASPAPACSCRLNTVLTSTRHPS